MTFSEETTDGVLVLGVTGKIQTETSDELLAKLNGLTDQGVRHFLLDFSGVEYINSSGLRVLLIVAKKLNRLAGKIVIANAADWIQEVLRVSGCAAVIGFYPSQEEALKAIKA
jgi:anti-sigma B factor antagonist